MTDLLAAVQIISYFVLLLLAGYVLHRTAFGPPGITTGGLLVSFALIQADQLLGVTFEGRAPGLARLLWIAYPLPAALWLRAIIALRPGDTDALDRAWWTLALPVAVLLVLGGWIGDEIVHFPTRAPGPLYWTFGVYNLAASLLALALVESTRQQVGATDRLHSILWWMRVASLGYAAAALGMVASTFSSAGILAPGVIFAAVVVDVVILGSAGITFDALAEGHSVRRDLLRTALKALIVVAVLVVPWTLALWDTGRWALGHALALLTGLGAAALGVPLQSTLERALDRLVLRQAPGESAQRDALRTLLDNTARQPARQPALATLDRDEFTRLTRRALSHMPNLPRLAASPLTQLHSVTTRTGDAADSLQRAGELRRLLAECIEELRPADHAAPDTNDAWRFYNALYFPYVAGVSPYRRGLNLADLDRETQDVLRWFQAAVPQRTMHNWQNRGAELIAASLLERERAYTAAANGQRPQAR